MKTRVPKGSAGSNPAGVVLKGGNMALHNRRYYRIQRQKHINRKKRIIKEQNNYWHYKHEGVLNKGKIHCGCGMCRSKTNNKGKHRLIHGNYSPSKNWKHSDKQKIESMNAAIADYEREITEIEALGTYFPRQLNAFEYYDDANWAYENELLEKMIADLPD